MKALILSCNTGQGHNTAGRAVLEAMLARGLDVEMRDALAFGGQKTSSGVSGGYIKITQSVPALFGRMYKVGSAISNPFIKSPVYYANKLYAEKLRDYIVQNGIDTVICPHLFPAEALTFLRRRHGLQARCYGVATDYTCTPFWEETDVDAFFIPHERLRAEYERKGIKPEKLIVTGIPVSRAFRGKTDMRAAREALGLPTEARIFLLMSGSMGFGDVPDIADNLLRLGGESTRVLVLTGHNDRLTKKLNERFGAGGRVTPVGFTDKVALYMDACDATLTKPGGLTSTEAAVKNVPYVLTAPIPGCETVNQRFLGELGVALPTTTPLESAQAAMLLCVDEPMRLNELKSQREQINSRAADDIVDLILKRA